jgi:hypothetical protein
VAYHRDYYVADRSPEIVTAKKQDGSVWKEQPDLFNGALAQFNPSNTSEVFSMHVSFWMTLINDTNVLTTHIAARP